MIFDRSLYELKDLQRAFVAGFHAGNDYDPAAMAEWAEDVWPKYERWSKAQDWKNVYSEPLFVEGDMRAAFLQGFRGGQQQELPLEQIKEQFDAWRAENYE
jgi:hypothetical protein